MEPSMQRTRTVLTILISGVIGAGLAAQGMRGGTRLQPAQ